VDFFDIRPEVHFHYCPGHPFGNTLTLSFFQDTMIFDKWNLEVYLSSMPGIPNIIKNFLTGPNIRTRIIVRYTIIILISVFTVVSVLYFYIAKITEDEINDYSNIIINQISKNIDNDFNNLDALLNSIYNYNSRESLLESNDRLTSYQLLQMADKALEIIRNILFLRNDIVSVTIYSLKNHYVYERNKDGDYTFESSDRFLNAAWYQRLMYSDTSLYTEKSGPGSDPDLLKVYKKVKGSDLKKDVGIIQVDLNYRQMKEAFDEVKYVHQGRIIILSSSGEIIYDTEEARAGYSDYQSLNRIQLPKSGIAEVNFHHNRFFVKKYYQEKTGWNILYLTSVDSVYRVVKNIKKISGITALLLIVVLTYLNRKFAASFSKPLEQITLHFKKIENGKLIPFQSDYPHQDEIAKLITGMNSMVEKINYLIESEYRTQLMLKDTQLNALIAQINPHFLYNVLENISGIGYANGIPELVLINENLIDLLKYCINFEKPEVPLRLELESLKKYIQIENARFGNSIELQVKISPALLELNILKFTLQPLVENAILHGLAPKLYRGCIEISAQTVNHILTIFIRDNGVGIDAIKLSQLNYSLENTVNHHGVTDKKHHIGIENVNWRLKLFYGREYGLTYESVPQIGTTVILSIPAVQVVNFELGK
jgi:two-component system, sensor histidine kinase YesM